MKRRTTLCLLVASMSISLMFACKSAIPDGQLKSTISDRLLSTPGMTLVSASVEKGVAKLTGTVSTDNDKTLAESLAKIEGINTVDNQIMVVTPTPEPEVEIVEEEPQTWNERARAFLDS